MTSLREQMTLLVVTGFVCLLATDACPYKECFCDEVSILCENKGFTSLPLSFATQQSDQTSLILDTNLITTIPAGSLPANLTQLSLDENPVMTIDQSAFDASAYTLKILSFSNALFTRIPDVLLHLHALTQFRIYETNITDWNVNAMKSIGQTLQKFYLAQVGITAWPDFIQYFPHLTDLGLTSMSIATIPDNALDNVAGSLASLSLDSNSFISVPKALSKLAALQILTLSRNKIVDVAWLPADAKIFSLELDYNRISDAEKFSKAVANYGDSLDNMDLSNNRLTVIPNFAFLKKMTEFDFTSNQISDPFSGSVPPSTAIIHFENNDLPSIPSIVLSLTSVIELLLSSNVIRELRGDKIPQWIAVIRIDYNVITEITDTSFPANSSLSYLNLNYNPVSKISLSAFKNVEHLSELVMQGTKLTRLPLAFQFLANLIILDVTGSNSLVCTCLEKTLGPWFARMPDYTVSGACGNVDVYFFFVHLSPSCPAD